MGMPYYPFGGAADSGKRVVLARNQGIAGLTQDGVPVGRFNAIWVEVYLASASGSAIVSVEGAGSEGGNYLPIVDPNAFPTTRTGSVAFEVSLGCPWAKVRLASVSGTWMVVATPFNSGGSSRARPNYYDRNPEGVLPDFAGSASPHALTTRDTYTVPAGRKAYLEYIGLMVRRATAATTPLRFAAIITFFDTVLNKARNLDEVWSLTNTVGSGDRDSVASSIHLTTGDIITLQTIDESTGGVVTYNLITKLTEYDA